MAAVLVTRADHSAKAKDANAARRMLAICPRAGKAAGLVLPRPDTEGVDPHLKEISRQGAEGVRAASRRRLDSECLFGSVRCSK